MTPRLPIKDAVSAGGVVWRREQGGRLEVVLCGRRADGLWGLPKGTPDPGEPLEQTALREVEEETGLLVKPGGRLGTIDYWFVSRGVRYHKYVHHWLFSPVGGDLSHHDHEFDDVNWFAIEEAFAAATYENERRIIAEAASVLGAPL
ncbi:MAG: NUDIX hydrolase [Tepidiformaceae bacterium]